MNEQTRYFKHKVFAWAYYWRLLFCGYDPAKPKQIESFLWGMLWEVQSPRLHRF